MKKRTYLLPVGVLLVLPVIILVWCCTKPTKDFVLNISSNVIDYKATLQFVDAKTGVVPAGLSVSLAGTDAANIYDYSGTKELKLTSSGLLTVGVDPSYNPTSNTLSFNIVSNGTNYLAVNTPVSISGRDNSQNFVVSMINVNNTPAGVKTVQPTAAISAGTTSSAVTATTTTDANTTTTASITVPAGTQLKDANNTVINGSSVKVVVASFDPAQQAAMQALPGGQVQHDVVGGTSAEVFFLPAGFATVNMYVNNIEVRNFSAAASVQMGLNANTFNPSTNATIKAGDNLNLYSYQVQTGEWKFEQTVPVTSASGKLVVNFTTNHLTTFAACVPSGITPCTTKPYLVFNAPGINTESSDVFIVDVYPTGVGNNPAPVYSQYINIHNGDSLQFTALPSGSLNVRVSRVDYDHYLLSDYNNRGTSVGTATVNLCSATAATAITVNFTGSGYLKGTGYAICPNDNSRRYLPPDGAEVYYRKSGTGDKLRILGLIVKGAVTTSLLTVGQSYDLFGNYGGKQVGRNGVVIRQGVSFLDSIHIINTGSTFCP